MTTFAGFHTPSRAPAQSRAAAAILRVTNATRQMWKSIRNRREFYRLGEMSDAELADIGLTRTDLHVAIDTPFGVDPTARLGAIASSRLRSIEDGARLVG